MRGHHVPCGSPARRDERGLSLSVWTAVAMPAFIIAVGLGVDFSGHTAAQQEARAVAAQAARAATHETVLTASGPQLDVAAARRAGRDFAADAGFPAEVGVERGSRVRVTVTGSYRTVFLGLIGVDSITFQSSGTAEALSVLDGEQA